MAIPKYNEFMKPMLDFLADGNIHKTKELHLVLAKHFNLSDEEMTMRVTSGKTLTYKSRIGWAASYLLQAKLIKSQKRGEYQITDEGRDLLRQNIQVIDKALLLRYPTFVDFVNRSAQSSRHVDNSGSAAPIPSEDQTPEVAMDEAYKQILQTLSDDLLLEIMNQTPDFFEQLVVDLLVSMGYGGSTADMALVIGQSGDEGIDGVIKEDKLGFDSIYIQAKRWDLDTTISRSEVQKFVGALAGQGATKGLFISTAGYSKGAIEYAKKQHTTKVVLVDGHTLASLMIEYNLGVSSKAHYEIKSIDTDYFSGDE